MLLDPLGRPLLDLRRAPELIPSLARSDSKSALLLDRAPLLFLVCLIPVIKFNQCSYL